MKSTDYPCDVSVLIAAWQAEATLARAIESVLTQSKVSAEVIVADDASSDGTSAVAQKFAKRHAQVRYLRLDVNSGPSAARNAALAAAQGRYVTPLDSDDYMAPGRLARLVETAQSGAWDMVADDLFLADEATPETPRCRLWSQTDIGVVPLDFEGFVRGNLSSLHGGRGELGFLKPLILRDFLTRAGLSYRADMRLGEDYDLYATALKAGARFCLTDPAGYYAIHRDASLSGRHSAADLAALVDADRRLLGRSDLTGPERAILRRHLIETLKRANWMALIDAVKTRDPAAALRCFAAPPQVGLTLMGRLVEQAVIRSTRRLSGRPASGTKDLTDPKDLESRP